ncbi:MAG: sporulation protein YabP [Clostridia bacterium]|nr:sporulation protein YabP [Clostridia bacterium]
MKEEQRQEGYTVPHLLSLSERRVLSVSGVQDVDSFDDTTVVIYTELGELTVKGNSLHIQRLNVETGDLSLEGLVESLTYTEVHSRSGGFFGRLFR